MSARLFLSCSQDKSSSEEMRAVSCIKDRLTTEFGFEVLVAVQENHFNGNPALLDVLKECDYFLFIDFTRAVAPKKFFSRFSSLPKQELPISIYSHQELAMAWALGFDSTNMLIFHQKGMKKEGMLGHMFINDEFENYGEAVDKILDKVRQAEWTSGYSRKLVANVIGLKDTWDNWWDKYSNPRGGDRRAGYEHRRECIALVSVENRRKDIAAINCVVHLKNIKKWQDGNWQERANAFLDPAPIKAAGVNGYSHTIWPGQTVQFDLFSYDIKEKKVFMHTECDVTDAEGCRKPLLEETGIYTLIYEVYAEHFPVVVFEVKVELGSQYSGITVDGKPLIANIMQSSSSSSQPNTPVFDAFQEPTESTGGDFRDVSRHLDCVQNGDSLPWSVM